MARRKKRLAFETTASGCFEVTSHGVNNRKYVNLYHDGNHIGAHRFIYEQCFGVIPKDMVVRHSCDNMHCVNPEHLLLGTQRQNIHDAIDRHRLVTGERHHNATITEKQAALILKDVGKTTAELARQYGISETSISCIRQGKTWCAVPGPRRRPLPSHKLTEVEVREILSTERSHQAIAKSYGVSRRLVGMIKQRVVWQHVNV